MLEILDVNDLYLWQFDALIAFCERDEAVLPCLCVMPGLCTRRGSTKKHLCAQRLCQYDGSAAGMVTGHGILLLVGCLMFFVNNDESEALERQEDRTTGAKDHIVGILGKLLLPNLDTFGISIFRMVDAQTVTKDTLETIHHLNSKRNLGQKIEHLLFLVEGLLDEVDIDFRLTAGRDTVKQRNRFLEEGKLYLVESLLLGKTKRLDLFGMGFPTMIQTPHFLFVCFDKTAFNKGRNCGEGVTFIQ